MWRFFLPATLIVGSGLVAVAIMIEHLWNWFSPYTEIWLRLFAMALSSTVATAFAFRLSPIHKIFESKLENRRFEINSRLERFEEAIDQLTGVIRDASRQLETDERDRAAWLDRQKRLFDERLQYLQHGAERAISENQAMGLSSLKRLNAATAPGVKAAIDGMQTINNELWRLKALAQASRLTDAAAIMRDDPERDPADNMDRQIDSLFGDGD